MEVSPIYIVSKNRWGNMLTNKALDLMGVDYKIVIEEHQYKQYCQTVDKDKLLALPYNYLEEYETCDDQGDTKSKGPGAARNFAMDHSKDSGSEYHWVMDDNIHDFHRLHKNLKVPIRSNKGFLATEAFVRRFSNVPLAGLNYYSFCKSGDSVPPFKANTRIYSCLLINNYTIGLRWRGRYNEDTDLSLRVLKRGDCTIQMNAFLCGKVTTQRMRGGNTDDFYAGEGTLAKSKMLADLHPDVARVVWRFNRWHHHVEYGGFAKNELRLYDDWQQRQLIDPSTLDFEMVEVPFKRSEERPEYWGHN